MVGRLAQAWNGLMDVPARADLKQWPITRASRVDDVGVSGSGPQSRHGIWVRVRRRSRKGSGLKDFPWNLCPRMPERVNRRNSGF